MTHHGMEYSALVGSMPSLRQGSFLLGDRDPWYVISPTSFCVGNMKAGQIKWRNVSFESEPPARVGFSCWLQQLEGRDFIFVFGGQVVDETRTGGAGKIHFKPSTKMFCCDVEQKKWRSVLMSDPTPPPRAHASCCALSDGALLGFGRGLPEQLKLADVWRFDVSQARIEFPDVEGCYWRQLEYSFGEPRPSPRLGASFLAVNPNTLLVFGGQVGAVGCKEDTLADDMWQMDVASRKWKSIQYAGYYPGARRGAHFVRASNTELILIGGYTSPDTASLEISMDPGGGPQMKSGTQSMMTGGASTGAASAGGGGCCLDTLVYDIELSIFTRPAIGFLPRRLSPNICVAGKVPCLVLNKRDKQAAFIQYPGAKKPPPKREEPAEEMMRNDAERILFRTRKEIDEIEQSLQGVCKEKADVKSQLDEVMAAMEPADEVREAYDEIERRKAEITRQEDVEGDLLSWISEETTYRRNASLLNRHIKNLVAAAEAKLFSEQVLEYSLEQDIDDARRLTLEADTETAYTTHAEHLERLRSLLESPEFKELLAGGAKREARKKKIEKMLKDCLPEAMGATAKSPGASRKNSARSQTSLQG
ncbi:unnamed protein product [Amoebophrya sp. A25]|nr:unnamed protein product [Amoebophrya sp. A25]|eukprot:GSA25T00015161001.1